MLLKCSKYFIHFNLLFINVNWIFQPMPINRRIQWRLLDCILSLLQMDSIHGADLYPSLVCKSWSNSFVKGTMILSSQYSQILVFTLITMPTCQSSDINTEEVRQLGTELILEEISQVWIKMDIGCFFFLTVTFRLLPSQLPKILPTLTSMAVDPACPDSE